MNFVLTPAADVDDMAQSLMAKSAKSIPVAGSKLTELRDSIGHTQESFARLIGMTRSGVARIEGQDVTGMSKSKFRALAEYLKLDMVQLKERIGPAPGKQSRREASNVTMIPMLPEGEKPSRKYKSIPPVRPAAHPRLGDSTPEPHGRTGGAAGPRKPK